MPGNIYLLTSEVLDKVNFSTIANIFDALMYLLWPDGIRHDDVLLFMCGPVYEKNWYSY